MKPDVRQRVHSAAVKEKDHMNRTICIVLLMLLGLVSCDETPLTDLSVRSLKVTQGKSGAHNLVSQRLTTVQAVIETDASDDITNVVGALSVAVDGVIIAIDVAAVNGAVTIPAGGKGLLRFSLEAPTGISPSSSVDFLLTLSAPNQFLQDVALDLTFDAPSIAAVAPLVREASRLSLGAHIRKHGP